jgi:nucleotide-binding universal stress UspA family protein
VRAMRRSTVTEGGNPRMTRSVVGSSVGDVFRSIVIGYDGPDGGREATALAQQLRDPRTGTLLLASAYPLAPLMAGGFVVPEEIEALHATTERMLAEARDALPDTERVRIRAVASDSPPRALTELAAAEHADLIVVGSSHRGPLGRVFPGATAERLLHTAPCAVAVAPGGYRGGDIRRIGVAYDGSPEADAALRAAEAFALERTATLTVYCVVKPTPPSAGMIAAGTGAEWPSQAARRRARKLLYAVRDNAPQGLKPQTLLLHGVPAEEIATRAHGAFDVLFAGSRGYGLLRRELLGSVSGALLRDGGCPVVITPRSAVATAPRPPMPKEVESAGRRPLQLLEHFRGGGGA